MEIKPCKNEGVHRAHDWKRRGKTLRCAGLNEADVAARTSKGCGREDVHGPHAYNNGHRWCAGVRK